MGLPKCLSGYSSISWTFTECEKQMNIICFRKKSKNFFGNPYFRCKSRVARTIARASGPHKITITCSCNLEKKLHWISTSLPKAFYVHTLSFSLSLSLPHSSSDYIKIYKLLGDFSHQPNVKNVFRTIFKVTKQTLKNSHIF
jgi:hypothetical protein